MRSKLLFLCCLSTAATAFAQSQSELKEIVERLKRLEEQNRELTSEVRALRQELSASREKPPDTVTADQPQLAERVEVQESRVQELAQSKVETEHRLPIQLTGMVLFNTFWNGKYSGGANNPVTASQDRSTSQVEGSFRQSVLGFKFQGPEIFGGGKVNGSLLMDFFAGTGTSLNQLMRVRVASLDLDWKRTTLSFAQDKPILAPREPTSLAQVGVSPLTQAGNLWIWQPQIRVEQRFALGDTAGLRAQFGVFQTNEPTGNLPPEYVNSVPRSRPGLQGRVELWKDFGNGRRIEIAPAFHVSNTKIGEYSLPARVYSIDWLIRPISRIDFTGTFYGGENANVISGLRPGITFRPDGSLHTIACFGGWAQITYRATARTSFNFYGGQQNNRAADLLSGNITRNLAYAGNIMYKLGSNVLIGVEASQVRTTFLGGGTRLVPHYDLALAYLY